MKAILIDDEQLALDLLEQQLQKIEHVHVTDTFINPFAGKAAILEQPVDVVFLDINMPEINGLELAEKLLEHKPELMVVFVTAYNEHAVEAFELNALDYVVKPVKNKRLEKTIKRLKQSLSQQVQVPLNDESYLHIHLCNYLAFRNKADKLEKVPWRTAKARELFLYLLQNNQQHVQKSTLIELLWPTFEREKAFAQLYTMVYHVRKSLQSFGDHFKLENTPEGYLLTAHDVKIDVEIWETKMLTVPALSRETIDTYLHIMNLYTGPYLQDYDYLWAEPERQRLEQLWLRTAYQLADFYRVNGNDEKAIMWYTKIHDCDPGAEEAYFSLMKIYANLQSDLLVQQYYYMLLDSVERELGLEPREEIVDWYRQWKLGTIKA